MRKVILYIAMSLDGFIAKKDDDISWLTYVEMKDEDYGYAEFTKKIDTVIMGRRTYDKVITFGINMADSENQTFIITHQQLPSKKNLHFYNGDITTLINDLKIKPGKDIFVDGGAEIVNLLLKFNLIDEYIISVIPVLLGSGIRLFDSNGEMKYLELIESKSFSSGLVQMHYRNNNNKN